jgi:hypothetical protein
MNTVIKGAFVALGIGIGLALGFSFSSSPKPTLAGTTDRTGDYIICTGSVWLNPAVPTDGVWMLDYRSGKLLGTVIDRGRGKITGWAEVDLVKEFEIAPKADVHFMMTTGQIAQGQSALYIAETTTGKFGVYTMGSNEGNGLVIRRHDMTTFRATK